MPTTRTAAYQRTAFESAAPRRDADSFDRDLGTIARRLRLSVHDLTDDERQLLEEYGRGASRDGEPRYRLITFRRLCAIARRSRRAEDRDALAELVHREVTDGVDPSTVEVVFDQETASTGPTDVAQRAFEHEPNPITQARCREALERQLATTRAALDVVNAVRFE